MFEPVRLLVFVQSVSGDEMHGGVSTTAMAAKVLRDESCEANVFDGKLESIFYF